MDNEENMNGEETKDVEAGDEEMTEVEEEAAE